MAGTKVEFLGGHKDSGNWHLKFKMGQKQYLYDPIAKSWSNRDILGPDSFGVWSASMADVAPELSEQLDRYIQGTWVYLGQFTGFHHFYYAVQPSDDMVRHIFMKPSVPTAQYYLLGDDDIGNITQDGLTYKDLETEFVEEDWSIDANDLYQAQNFKELIAQLDVDKIVVGNFKLDRVETEGRKVYFYLDDDISTNQIQYRIDVKGRWEYNFSNAGWKAKDQFCNIDGDLQTLANKVLREYKLNQPKSLPYWAVILITAAIVFAVLLAVTAFGAFLPAAAPFAAFLKTVMTSVLSFVKITGVNLSVPGILFGVTAALELVAVTVATALTISLTALGRLLLSAPKVKTPSLSSASDTVDDSSRMQEEEEEQEWELDAEKSKFYKNGQLVQGLHGMLLVFNGPGGQHAVYQCHDNTLYEYDAEIKDSHIGRKINPFTPEMKGPLAEVVSEQLRELVNKALDGVKFTPKLDKGTYDQPRITLEANGINITIDYDDYPDDIAQVSFSIKPQGAQQYTIRIPGHVVQAYLLEFLEKHVDPVVEAAKRAPAAASSSAVSEEVAASAVAQELPELPKGGWRYSDNQSDSSWHRFDSGVFQIYIKKADQTIYIREWEEKAGSDGMQEKLASDDYTWEQLPFAVKSLHCIKTQVEGTTWGHSDVRADGVYIYKPSVDEEDTREIRIMPGQQRGWVRFVADATGDDEGTPVIFHQLPETLRQLHQETKLAKEVDAITAEVAAITAALPGSSGSSSSPATQPEGSASHIQLAALFKSIGDGSGSEASQEPVVHPAPTSVSEAGKRALPELPPAAAAASSASSTPANGGAALGE